MKDLVLTDELTTKIESLLEQLELKLPGSSLLLTDIAGRPISFSNNAHHSDPVSLGALVAGNMAATTEIAHQIGEHQPFQMIFHEGDQNNIYLCDVGGSFLLVVVFDDSLQLGVVRLFTRQALKELLVLAEEFERIQIGGISFVDKDFGSDLSAEIEQVFQDTHSGTLWNREGDK